MALKFLNNGYFAGKVGIGTNSPDNKLVVQTPFTTSTSNSYIEVNSGHEASGGGDISGTTGILFKQAGSGNVLRSAGSIISGRESNYSTSSLADSYLSFFTAVNNVNTERIRINSAGNVGIGTDSPTTKLYVDGGESTVNRGNSAGTIATFRGQNAEKAVIGTATSWFAGNVGIGTNSPGGKLDIKTAMGTSGQFDGAQLRLESTNTVDTTGFQGIRFATSTTPNYGWSMGANRSGSGRGSFRFFEHQNNATGVERFTIKQDGNVGIGTSSPSEKLEVAGSIRIDSTSVAQMYLDSAANNDSVLNFQENSTQKGKIGYDTSLAGFGIVAGSGAFSTADMVVLDNGKVGIGTTSPGQKLVIANSTNGQGLEFIPGTISTIQSFDRGGNVYAPVNIDALDVRLRVDNGNEAMRVTSSGNVGIGTTSPSEKLHVDSIGTNYVARFRHSTGTGYAPGSILLEAGQSVTRGQGVYHYNNIADENWFTGVPYSVNSKKWIVANKYSAIQSVDTAQLTYALMTIDSDTGNVGIGTTSPGAKLDVAAVTGAAIRLTSTGNGLGANGIIGSLEYYGSDNSTPGPGVKSSIVSKTEASLGDDSNLIFSTSNGVTNNIERMRITPAGGVSFGSTGTAYGASGQILKSNGNASPTWVAASTVIGGPYLPLTGGTLTGALAGTDASFTGNVGIGATTVGAKLDIVGSSLGIRVKQANLSDVLRVYTQGSGIFMDNGNVHISDDLKVGSTLISNQENTDIDSAAAEVVAQVAHATYTAAFFDFVVKKGTNVRSGTVYACHDGTNVEFTETSTQDLGDTSDVVLSVDISGTQMRLLATVTSDDWSVKSLIRAI